MPRFSQRIRKTRKARKSRKQKRKATRRSNQRKQRGGIENMVINNNVQNVQNVQGLKDQLFELLTTHQDYDQIVEFIHNQIEQPIIHPNFPIEVNNTQYTMMIYGHPHNNEEQTTMLLIHIRKDANGFTEVAFETMEGQVRAYLEQNGNPELMPMNAVHSAIEQATTDALLYV